MPDGVQSRLVTRRQPSKRNIEAAPNFPQGREREKFRRRKINGKIFHFSAPSGEGLVGRGVRARRDEQRAPVASARRGAARARTDSGASAHARARSAVLGRARLSPPASSRAPRRRRLQSWIVAPRGRTRARVASVWSRESKCRAVRYEVSSEWWLTAVRAFVARWCYIYIYIAFPGNILQTSDSDYTSTESRI